LTTFVVTGPLTPDAKDGILGFILGQTVLTGAITVGLLVVVILFGWRKTVFVERPRIRWAWGIPAAIFGLAAVITIACSGANISRLGLSLVLGYTVWNLFVGISEELVFRGIVLSGLRGSRLPEWAAMAITAVAFGSTHFLNLLGGQDLGDTLRQVILASLYGLTLYLAFRASGTLLFPMAIHWLWDLCQALADDTPFISAVTGIGSLAATAGGLVAIALVIVGAVRDRRTRLRTAQ